MRIAKRRLHKRVSVLLALAGARIEEARAALHELLPKGMTAPSAGVQGVNGSTNREHAHNQSSCRPPEPSKFVPDS